MEPSIGRRRRRLDVALAVRDVRGLAEVPRDGFADGADVGEVAVRLVRVVDGAERLERHERLRVQQARRGARRHVVVAVEVARVDVAERRLGVREPGLVEHGHVLERRVVRGVARALGLRAVRLALALRARRAPLGLALAVASRHLPARRAHLPEQLQRYDLY